MSPPSILLSLALLLPIAAATSSYIQISSNGGNKTTAVRSPPRRPVLFAREFLNAHNKVRTNVSHPVLVWDKKLARYARRWAMKCASDCRMAHSLGPYGENLFKGGRGQWTPTKAVQSWAAEKEDYAAGDNSCANGKMCGHYTQMIWRDSARVGCTLTKCQAGGGVLVVCEYDPPGNYVNESPFQTTAAAVHGGVGSVVYLHKSK